MDPVPVLRRIFGDTIKVEQFELAQRIVECFNAFEKPGPRGSTVFQLPPGSRPLGTDNPVDLDNLQQVKTALLNRKGAPPGAIIGISRRGPIRKAPASAPRDTAEYRRKVMQRLRKRRTPAVERFIAYLKGGPITMDALVENMQNSRTAINALIHRARKTGAKIRNVRHRRGALHSSHYELVKA